MSNREAIANQFLNAANERAGLSDDEHLANDPRHHDAGGQRYAGTIKGDIADD